MEQRGRSWAHMRMIRAMTWATVMILGTIGAASFAAERDSAAAAVVIDVRTQAEWNEGHLEGAVLIPYDRIGSDITTVVADKKTTIFLYCRTGRRTGIAFDVLTKAGYEDLVNLGTVENASKTLNRAVVK
jgi:phage shock protein E